MIYAAVTLACRPDLQDRMIEEIDNVYADVAKQGLQELDYRTNWHRFPYTLAFMVSGNYPESSSICIQNHQRMLLFASYS